ncbi:MAG: 6-bladed beta-propeller [Hydrogenophilales bacterium CG_4_9_14_3_um_filter_63_34]|nr:MAG: 6-bladed beta-propeller [Hydrogenophilales bacterium CG_4_10_14_3_um_filter_63_21]PJB03344.1 MAG: 6-bladed beta-propeller [Hydrogenophilales bacterium CG_4_9_14_3_um_filter_63_34]
MMRLKRIFRYGLAVCLAVGLATLTAGCFKMAVPDSKPATVILWPAPPEIPRISFVNAIARPEDLGIKDGVFKGFLKYLLGKPATPMVNPYGLAVDAEGRLYVVDNFLKKIHVYDRQEENYALLPEKGDGFVSPIGIAVDDRRGRIYVTDSAQAVVKIFAKGEDQPVGEIKSGGLGRPTGIAVNEATDELLVVDTLHSGIQRYSLADHSLKGVIGLEGAETGQFHSPTHIAVSRAGTIFVTDALNFRVQVLTPEGKFIRSFGAAGDGPGYFSRPKGVAVDGDGNIYVVDALFDNIQVFDPEGRLLMSFGKPGQELGEFWLPSGIFIDRHNRIYVSDSYNKRVQIFQYLKGGELP